MDGKYFAEYRIPSYELDTDRLLKLSSILKLMQETAGRHLDQDGQTYEAMRKSGVVFLITRAAVKIKRLPGYGETVKCGTWFRGTKGVYFCRDMRFFDESGADMIDMETLWIIADPLTHKILRPAVLPFTMPAALPDHVSVRAERIEKQESTERKGTWLVRNSDIDCNHHLSNTVYADMIMDFLPSDVRGRDIGEWHLSFLGEALTGQSIEISSREEPERIFLEGTCGGSKCFDALVKKKQRQNI